MSTKSARQSLNMSIRQFALAVGVSENTARRWEMDPKRSGFRQPSEPARRLIASLLTTKDNPHEHG